MAGFLGKAAATFPAAIYYTSSERSLSRQWLYEYEINPIDLPFRIDCNGSLWGSYGWE
ncbi:MAG: hypothetical protein NC043_07345 [Muribaculaceae bacterium]|nr:hypothetical protein [Muribaculaceae bacterium]